MFFFKLRYLIINHSTYFSHCLLLIRYDWLLFNPKQFPNVHICTHLKRSIILCIICVLNNPCATCSFEHHHVQLLMHIISADHWFVKSCYFTSLRALRSFDNFEGLVRVLASEQRYLLMLVDIGHCVMRKLIRLIGISRSLGCLKKSSLGRLWEYFRNCPRSLYVVNAFFHSYSCVDSINHILNFFSIRKYFLQILFDFSICSPFCRSGIHSSLLINCYSL